MRLRYLLFALLLSSLLLANCTPEPTAPPATEAAVETESPTETEIVVETESAAETEVAAAETEVAIAMDAAADGLDSALLARGVVVYREQLCGLCHELDTANTRGRFGPSHNEIGLVATQRVEDDNYSGNAASAEEYLLESMTEPRTYFTPGFANSSHPMPTYEQLPPEDLEALVYLLVNQQ